MQINAINFYHIIYYFLIGSYENMGLKWLLRLVYKYLKKIMKIELMLLTLLILFIIFL